MADTTTVVPVTVAPTARSLVEVETYTLDPEFWSRHPRLLDGWPAETPAPPVIPAAPTADRLLPAGAAKVARPAGVPVQGERTPRGVTRRRVVRKHASRRDAGVPT